MGLVGDEPYEQEVAAAGTGLVGSEPRVVAGWRALLEESCLGRRCAPGYGTLVVLVGGES